MTQEALKLALEAFEAIPEEIEGWIPDKCTDAVIAIKKALAQPEQEPVAHWSDCAVHSEPAYPKGECDCGGFPPQRTWVDLTDEELADCMDMSIQKTCRAIEAKLKQKNGYAEEKAGD